MKKLNLSKAELKQYNMEKLREKDYYLNMSIKIDWLPEYLQLSIRDWLANKDDRYRWDMYYDDLYSSINMAQHGGEITEEEANELRAKYLWND